MKSTTDMRLQVNPSNFEKRLLVFAKFYPSVEEVPSRVSNTTVKHAKDYCRVRGLVVMMFLTFIGCVIMVRSGKRMAEQGDSLQNRELARIAAAQEAARVEKEAGK
jgi:predicted PurR-regulated permease PerM